KEVDRLATLLVSFKAAPRASDGASSTLLITFPGAGNFAIAEAYRTAGVPDKAEEFYKKATADKPKVPARIEELLDLTDPNGPGSSIPSYDQLVRYGEFLVERKRYKDAAGVFKRAWELAPVMPLTLFHWGHALAQAGDAKEGARLMGLAHWIPLGNEALRTKFSEDLTRRGFAEDSRKEMEIVLQAGWFRSYYVGNVHLRMGRLLARQKDFA